jgi:hypothetical protein
MGSTPAKGGKVVGKMFQKAYKYLVDNLGPKDAKTLMLKRDELGEKKALKWFHDDIKPKDFDKKSYPEYTGSEKKSSVSNAIQANKKAEPKSILKKDTAEPEIVDDSILFDEDSLVDHLPEEWDVGSKFTKDGTEYQVAGTMGNSIEAVPVGSPAHKKGEALGSKIKARNLENRNNVIDIPATSEPLRTKLPSQKSIKPIDTDSTALVPVPGASSTRGADSSISSKIGKRRQLQSKGTEGRTIEMGPSTSKSETDEAIASSIKDRIKNAGQGKKDKTGTLLPFEQKDKRVKSSAEGTWDATHKRKKTPVEKAEDNYNKLSPEEKKKYSTKFKLLATTGVVGTGAFAAWIFSDDKDENDIANEAYNAETLEDKKVVKQIAPIVKEGIKGEAGPTTIEKMYKKLKGLSKLISDNEERTDWDSKLQELRDVYEERKSDIEDRETNEAIIHGLVQMAAGLYGLSTGLNIGPLEFDKTDWEARHARNLKRLGMEEGALETAQRHEEARIKDQLGRMDAKQKQLFQIELNKLKDYQTAREKKKDRDLDRELSGAKESAKLTKDTQTAIADQDAAAGEVASLFNRASEESAGRGAASYQRGISIIAKKYNYRTAQAFDTISRNEDGEIDKKVLRSLAPDTKAILSYLDVSTDPKAPVPDRQFAAEELRKRGIEL